ncbi:MAG: hypothetical protein H6632_10610 [Anaerolineales bacterium]|nr:hypothetical protein [Anaerolineales bacterium]
MTALFAPASALSPIIRRPLAAGRRQSGAFIEVQRSMVGRLWSAPERAESNRGGA